MVRSLVCVCGKRIFVVFLTEAKPQEWVRYMRNQTLIPLALFSLASQELPDWMRLIICIYFDKYPNVILKLRNGVVTSCAISVCWFGLKHIYPNKYYISAFT